MSSSNHTLKVLHVASGDLWAGAESQIYTLVKTLNTIPGVSVSVVLMNHGELERRLIEEHTSVTVLDESCTGNLVIFKRLVEFIHQTQPDVIHTHRFKENILGSIAGYISGGIPSIRTVHGAPENSYSFHLLHKHLYRYLDKVTGRYLQKCIIAVSDNLGEFLSHQFSSENVYVRENGIDNDCVTCRDNISPHNDINNASKLNIGIAGRLETVKRIDIFIEAARYTKLHYPEIDTQFHIYGNGPLKPKLESLSKQLDADSYISFHGHVDNLPTELCKLDILVLTSEHEGLPMVLLESMACKTPIISHSVGGIPKLLNYGECGILIDSLSPGEYAKAISKLSKSRELRSQFADKALLRVKQKYSACANARSYLGHYRSLSN